MCFCSIIWCQHLTNFIFILFDDSFCCWWCPSICTRKQNTLKMKMNRMHSIEMYIYYIKNIMRNFFVMLQENSIELDFRGKWKKTRYLSHLWQNVRSLNLYVSMYGRQRVNVSVCVNIIFSVFDSIQFGSTSDLWARCARNICVFISTYQRFG